MLLLVFESAAARNMIKIFHLSAFLLSFISFPSSAQFTDSLRLKIQQIISPKKAIVGISIIGNNGKDTLSVNGERHCPMQSVFKFHIALAMLSQIDKGKFSLDQKIEILEKEFEGRRFEG